MFRPLILLNPIFHNELISNSCLASVETGIEDICSGRRVLCIQKIKQVYKFMTSFWKKGVAWFSSQAWDAERNIFWHFFAVYFHGFSSTKFSLGHKSRRQKVYSKKYEYRDKKTTYKTEWNERRREKPCFGGVWWIQV